jgi:hypothetical protein
MGKVKKIFKSVTSILGLSAPKAPEIQIPAAQIPAPPAPSAITDTGASVSIGTSADVKNQRVSGRTSGRSTGSGNFLAGLGRSGLNI